MSTEADTSAGGEEEEDKPQPEYVEHITKKSDDFNQWYVDVVRKAELADYTPVKGCMVIRPYGFALWENVRQALDDMIKATGHQNMYFPLFIPESYLMREADHVEGFAPEVAWVTRGGNTELEEPLAIRATSEPIIGPLYKKWIRSHRDLPVLINQWANVVRWEKRTRLFLRTTEFLWQEGHTFHATSEEAAAEADRMLECYRVLAEDWCAMPVISGRKTDAEKFAGADYTLSIEALMSDGKALQSGTSHHLGQNFTTAYDITFADKDNQLQHPHGTSWGLSTRVIGGIIMTHGDDSGLILPPRIAPIQVVIVPIYRGDDEAAAVMSAVGEVRDQIEGTARFDGVPLRVHVDDRDEKPGFKYNDWELRGVPLRVEVGPRDVEAKRAVVVDRLERKKVEVAQTELPARLAEMLTQFQAALFQRAIAIRASYSVEVSSRAELDAAFADGKNALAHGPWCGNPECEAEIKDSTRGVTIRTIGATAPSAGATCAGCGKPARHLVYWARAY